MLGSRENILYLPEIKQFLGHPSNWKALLLPLSKSAGPCAGKFYVYVQ